MKDEYKKKSPIGASQLNWKKTSEKEFLDILHPRIDWH